MRIASIALILWLIAGAVAAGQRNPCVELAADAVRLANVAARPATGTGPPRHFLSSTHAPTPRWRG
jgi:hypothetical protein